ncbi:hypothetical protein ACFWPV_12365 [Streptomyces uncialis]|uniref:hypothetical protein n=1 Tax=Streptomyces uncialis TaxID=1048205 RepID=UPI00365F411D
MEVTVQLHQTALLLHRHKPGTLVALDHYLHERTGGMIGALSHLIRGAAIDAILMGTEELDRSGVDSIPLDVAATAQGRKKRRASR